MALLDKVRALVRSIMRRFAVVLNQLTGGKLHPDTVTIVGCLMHIPIAWLIASRQHYVLAAILLLVFGLFDTLDGELSRLQKRSSARGMLLDASTDRIKEVLLYTGAAYALALSKHPTMAVWAVAACGASLCVSYIKAKGESAIATTKQYDHAALNHLFKDGLLTFEIRMFVLMVGLFANRLDVVLVFIAVLASYTALQRLVRISRALA